MKIKLLALAVMRESGGDSGGYTCPSCGKYYSPRDYMPYVCDCGEPTPRGLANQ